MVQSNQLNQTIPNAEKRCGSSWDLYPCCITEQYCSRCIL